MFCVFFCDDRATCKPELLVQILDAPEERAPAKMNLKRVRDRHSFVLLLWGFPSPSCWPPSLVFVGGLPLQDEGGQVEVVLGVAGVGDDGHVQQGSPNTTR